MNKIIQITKTTSNDYVMYVVCGVCVCVCGSCVRESCERDKNFECMMLTIR